NYPLMLTLSPGRGRGDLVVRCRARPRYPIRDNSVLAAARRLGEPESDARRHGAAGAAWGPRARPAAREGGHLGHAPDDYPARAGDGPEGEAAVRRCVPGCGLGRGHVLGGEPGAPSAGARRPAVPRPVRGGLPDPEGREVLLRWLTDGARAADAGGGAAG